MVTEHGMQRCLFLKTLILLVIVKDQYSHLMYLNLCIKKQTCENLSPIGRKTSCKIIKKEQKKPLSHEVVCFQMLDSKTSNSKSEVWKSNLWKITSYRKLSHFRGSRFSQCFIPSTSPHYL